MLDNSQKSSINLVVNGIVGLVKATNMTIEFNYNDVYTTKGLPSLVKLIFKTKHQREMAIAVIKYIKENGEYQDIDNKKFGIRKKVLKNVISFTNITRPIYYKVLIRFLNIGLLKKEFDYYYFSNEFSLSLRRLERAFNNLTKNI